MNIELIGGPLYQWDTGRKIKINCPEAVEAHFEDREADKSPVLEIREEKGERVADIPNYMLQRHGQLVVYLVKVSDTSVQTKHSYPLFIHARQRPSEYVYTETEVLDYRKIAQEALERLDETEGFALAAQESARVAQEAQTATEEARADAEKLVNEAETAKDETLETLNATKEATQVALNAAGLAQWSEARAGERANEAEQSAQNAASSEQTAKTAEQEAKAAQAETETAKQSAEKSATEAKEARAGAERLALDAQTAQKAAESAKAGAESAEQIAKDKANEAGQSASRAEASEQAAKQSETNAANAASEAAQSAAEAKQSAEDAKGVRTVNGVSPDANGNVEIVAGKQSDWSESDPESLAYVKNRTHYESVETVNEPLSITWDGNTEGLIQVVGDTIFHKVSDLILTDEQLKTAWYKRFDGNIFHAEDMWDYMIELGFITENAVNLDDSVVCVRKSGATMLSSVFPETGLYFCSEDGYGVTYFATTEPVEQTKTVVHKLDNKFLDLDWIPKKSDETVILDVAITGGQYEGAESLGLVVGDSYTVLLDGTPYVCTAFSYSEDGMNAILLGNGSPLGLEDTGEPFFVAEVLDMGVMAMAFDGADHTISVIGGSSVNKLPNEFLDLDWLPTKTPKYTYVVDEVTADIVGGYDGDAGAQVIPKELFAVGKKYIIEFDGVEYKCTAKDFTYWEKLIAIGNTAITNGTQAVDTGEPFLIIQHPETGASSIMVQTTGNHTYAVKYESGGYEYNPLPKEFLPEIPYFDLVEMGLPAMDVANGNFQISADMDTTELRNAMSKGAIKIKVAVNVGIVVSVEVIVANSFIPQSGQVRTCTIIDLEGYYISDVQVDDGHVNWIMKALTTS